MEHGWNTLCHTQLSEVISNPEENLGQHIDNLIDQSSLSNAIVSQETPSPGCSLDSNTILDPEQQTNYHDLQWNNVVAPSPLLDIQQTLIGNKNSSETDAGVHSKLNDAKSASALLSLSAPEQYSDVSSCSELETDRTMSPCVEIKPDFNHQSGTQERGKGWEVDPLELSLPSPCPVANSQNSVKGISPIKDIKGSIDPKQDLSEHGTSENSSTCQEGLFLSTVWHRMGDLREHLESGDKESRKDSYVKQEDEYSNISSPQECGKEQSSLSEDEGIDGDHSTAQDSEQMNTADCQGVSGEPHIQKCAFETNTIEDTADIPDGHYNDVTRYDNLSGKESVPCESEKGNNDPSLESNTAFSKSFHLEMSDKRQFDTESVSREDTHKDQEVDCVSPNNIEGERSSFDFLERCLGLKDFTTGIRLKSGPGKQVERQTDKDTAMSPDGNSIGGTELESWLPQTEPPTLAPVDKQLSLREEAQESSYTAACDQEPPVLSISKAASNSGKEVERQTDKETAVSSDGNSICGSELESWTPQTEQPTLVPVDKQLSLREEAQEYSSDEQLSALEEMEEDGVVSDATLVHLIAPQHLKQSLHPVVLLKNTNKSEGYHCAKCLETAKSLSSLIEHHHCVHSLQSAHLCQMCGCYFTNSNLAAQHECDPSVGAGHFVISKASLSLEGSRCLQKSQQEGKQGRAPHKCQYCTQTFNRFKDLYRHQREHTGITPFKCGGCGLYYSQSSSLNRHKRLNRCKPLKLKAAAIEQKSKESVSSSTKEQATKIIEIPPASPQFKLIDCYVKLVDCCKQKQPLKKHICQVCGKGFKLRAQLIAHRMSHTDESPFKCHICLSTFKYTCNLYRHKRLHCSGIGSAASFVSPLKSLVGEYKCPICRGVFKYSYNRFRHMREVCLKEYSRLGKGKVGNMYKCPLCQKTFSNASNRSRHIKRRCMREYVRRESLKIKRDYHERKKLAKEQQKPQQMPQLMHPQQNNMGRHKCSLCPASFAHASGKYKHMRKHKLKDKTGKPLKYQTFPLFSLNTRPDNTCTMLNDSENGKDAEPSPFSCRFCGKTFLESDSLAKHMPLHSGDRPYQCQECGKKFIRRSHLAAHKNVHQRRIQCTVCKKILPTISELIRHRQTHTKRGMLQCPDCPMQFKYPAFLLRHLRSHKQQASLLPKQEKQHQEFQCSLCRMGFGSCRELSIHYLKHIPKRSVNQCPICKRHFCSRAALVRHVRLHTGEKPFGCQACEKRFSRKETLRAHQEKCSETQPESAPPKNVESQAGSGILEAKKLYQCKYCPITFFWPCSLSKHQKNHMLNILFPCSKCGKCFKKLRLVSHEKDCNFPDTKRLEASRLQFSSCGKCGRTFCRDYNRSIHEKRCRGSSSGLPENAVKNVANRNRGIDKLKHRCPHCPKAFRYRCYLLRHLVMHTKDKKYECVHCGRKYANCQHYLEHEAFCNGVYRFKVCIAKKQKLSGSTTSSTKGGQMTRVDGEGEYKCKFCTKSFIKPRNLRRHILTHTEVKPYRCKTCDSCFSRYDHLKLHQNRCKGKKRLEVRIFKLNLEDLRNGPHNEPEKSHDKDGKLAKCGFCGKAFSSNINMARHVALQHTKIKPFVCNRCGASFSQECTLKKHGFKCSGRMLLSPKVSSSQQEMKADSSNENGIDKPCRETSKLLIRIQKHYSDKRKYACAYCPRRFRNHDQMVVHTRLHTGEKPFGCANCGERFIRRDYLKRHLLKCKVGRQIEERVLCDRCGELFFRDQLRSHQKNCVVKQKTPDRHATSPARQSESPQRRGFTCASCDARFLLFSQLQQHFLTKHREDTYQEPQRSPPPPQQQLSSVGNVKEEPVDEGYEGDQLRIENILSENMNVAGTETDTNKEFVCPYCNLRFCNNSGLGMHLRTHSGSFSYFCQGCQKGFWSKNTFRKHRRKCCPLSTVTKEEPNMESLTPIDDSTAINNTVLVFNSVSKATGTGVLQTKFSCKDGNKESMEIHEKRSSPRTTSNTVHKYQCSECDQSFTDGLLLISHLEAHGREEQEKKRRYHCNHCSKVFSLPGELSRHMRIHKIIKLPYDCPDCPKKFRCPSDLDVHRSLHDPNRPFVCRVCQFRFWTNSSLNKHASAVQHSQESDAIIACNFCDKTYALRASYRKHCRQKHHKEWKEAVLRGEMGQDLSKGELDPGADMEEKNTDSNDDEDEDDDGDDDSDSAPYFPCHVCGKTFTTSESLEDHQRCHLGEKPHECEECGKCFFQLSNLQQHQRSHKSEFQCQTCGRGFVSLFALRKHKHTHGKNRPHRCPKCQLSFTGPTQLAEHMATHRDENFPCDLCDRTFTCKLSRAEHRKSHTEQEDSLPPLLPPQNLSASSSPPSSASTKADQLKYRCGICCQRFRDPEQLSEHGCLAARERPYSCPDCNQHFLCGSHLKKHQLSHPLSRSFLYQCNRCHMCFHYRHHFLNHLKRHGIEEAGDGTEDLSSGITADTTEASSENIYKCPICPCSFPHALELAGHLSVHAESSYKCKVCSETFKSKISLMEHEQLHLTGSTQYECTECGDSFLGSEAFRQHHCARQQHTAKDKAPSLPSSPSSSHLRAVLPSAHQGSAAARNADEEEDVDVGEDFYNCLVCNKRFSSQQSLDEHQRLHDDYRPFKCLVCGKCFAQKRYLKKHQYIHQRAFRCNICTLSFDNLKAYHTHREQHNLKAQRHSVPTPDVSPHVQNTTVEDIGGDYRCDMCYKSFSQLSSLRRHQETHVGQVVYECTECDKAFAFFHLLEEHQRSHASSASPSPSSPPTDDPLSSSVTEPPTLNLQGANTSFPTPPVVEYVVKENLL